MILNELVKSFLTFNKEEKLSSEVKSDNTLIDLSSDVVTNTGAFFDEDNHNLFRKSDLSTIVHKQAEKIQKYRQISMTTDVADGVDEIVNEVIFSFDDKIPLKITINEENDKLIKTISDKFNDILKMMNIRRNLFEIVKRTYIDGQIVFHCGYKDKNTKSGIKSIKLIDPSMLYFDIESDTYKYLSEKDQFNKSKDSVSYSPEEIVKEDFGLYADKINLGYLEYALKPANMLRTLEDLLIPMRFSRSISRRVFNVDIGDLPNKRGSEVMQEMQNKFKYKKFYNAETGEVSNQQHITSMVEDYWFANRSGGKGTQVDTLDEAGNLGELDDILYFAKKLYKSMNIPNNRISINPDADNEFDYDTTRVTKDDMKFFMFISRIRQVYTSAIKEILRRELISTGVMKEHEWDEKEDLIEIMFSNENSFIEKMKLDNFMSKLDIYSTAQEYQGKLFSVNTILKDVFRFSDDEIEEEFKKIKDEEANDLYAKFYQSDDEGGKW